MKILNKFLLRSFIGPFVATFFIVLFVLVIQFLWKYVDDLVGKGLEFSLIAELIFYASASLVPMALPLAVLLSSIMTFGNLSEFNELTAIKASGTSVLRFMLPLGILTFFIAIAAFFFANNVLPVANLKFGALLYDVREQKPALSIQEGIFYNGIDGYSIKVGKKHLDNQTIEDILIYDHTDRRGNVKLLIAQKGKMSSSENNHILTLTLYNGNAYEEVISDKSNTHLPHMRTHFEEQTISFDLSAFKLDRTNPELFRDHYTMLTIAQLSFAIDSLKNLMVERNDEIIGYIMNSFFFNTDSVNMKKYSNLAVTEAYSTVWFDTLDNKTKIDILSEMKNNVATLKGYTEMLTRDQEYKNEILIRHYIEWHRKFTLSFACIVLFLIGGPMGAIIKKGGLGAPIIVCIIFFLIYHVISITGEKMSKEFVLNPNIGMWLSAIFLLPIGIFLLYKSNIDSKIFEPGTYNSLFSKIKRLTSKKRND